VRRIVGRMLFGIAAAGLLAGADPEKDTKKEEGVKGTVLKVDVSRNSITIKTKSGRQTYLVTGDTKYFGPTGEACANGMNDDRLATGNDVRIIAELSGKTAKEVHLSAGKRAGKDKNRGG
jgi:hypothetical protein